RLDEFAGVVSHDLRNPLNVATLSVQLAAQEYDSPHLDRAERAHSRMETLIEDLLTLARGGDKVESPEPVGLRGLAESAWANVATDKARLRVETGGDRTLLADQSRLSQLFENLYRNAVEHGGKGVTVTVGELSQARGIYIEDDGPGIPTEEQERIFKAGFSTAEDGTGFGLSIVKQVAEAHEWNIRTTTGHDGGARFEITGINFTE
ncbi:histidine kinase, partial [Halobacteriales archaeon QH_10_67_13]